ncbi:MAG TPA: outer membrane beta-barrel protein [Vicinamibacterales bacterium]|nr:outer membrane beta-barrel protein [Vicinamibacterales bacterium]
MTRVMKTALIVLGLMVGSEAAYAQDARPATEGRAVVTIIPGGATFLMEGKNSSGPSFGNYALGGSIVGNVNKYVGIEGEVTGSIGVSQELTGFTDNVRTPHMLSYSGNVVVSIPNRSAFVPYVSGGVGGTSVFETADLGINATTTFLTGNVGGGLKWYAGRWGLRADYRFIAVQGKDDAPEFFGTENRFAHRIYGGVLLNFGR